MLHTMSLTTQIDIEGRKNEGPVLLLACCRVRGSSRGLHSGQVVLDGVIPGLDPRSLSCLSLIFWRFGGRIDVGRTNPVSER